MSCIRPLTLAAIVALQAIAVAAAQETSQSPDDAVDIELRIRQLGDADFAVRQAASLALVNAGPAAIAPIAEAVRSDDPEVRTRALAALLAMARGRSDQTVLPAHRALAGLADDESPAIARRANVALVQLQLDVARDFERLGGSVQFDDRRRVTFVSLNERPAGDEQVSRMLLLSHLQTLNLSRTQITSSGLMRLAELPQLATLELRFTAIDSGGLVRLARTPRLTKLNLQGTAIDDRGAERLGEITQLELLSIERTAITDHGLAALCGLARLETLYLGESQITGANLAQLARLPRLKYLSLRGLELRDEHLASLGACTQLESIGLDETPVTAACLAHLQHLPRLRVLWLTNSQVDDAGAATLAAMKSLERLHVRGTKLSQPAVDELKSKMPGVEITY